MILHYQCQQCKGEFYVEEDNMPYNSSLLNNGKEFKKIYCFCPYCKSEDPVMIPPFEFDSKGYYVSVQEKMMEELYEALTK